MNEVIQQTEDQLRGYRPEGELRATAYWVIEETTGMSRTDILSGKCTKIVPEVSDVLRRIQRHEPVQYIFGHTYWRGMELAVNPSVLIPRPETSELVDWILEDNTAEHLTLTDAGTGSGCIAIALKKEQPKWQITALDLSSEAIETARKNGEAQGTDIRWRKADMLHLPEDLHTDILVSNPPYIMNKERAAMERNVLDYEPQTALFVPDSDPLLFYRALAGQHRAGTLYFEINPLQAQAMKEMLQKEGYLHIETRKDMQGKERMMKATECSLAELDTLVPLLI